ncbi:hypothetical protein HNP92_000910 [Methanococcus maripaludis]|uniref:DUF4435 domain-containing protein n=1 Tax=Methanococcus maripaludis TaxID=39152 RepID=A0A7J9S4N1_METMI|nr:hypothetical protein [Methanococcus maripaludis]MBB6401605.1 hypothetical protein [Methanococcus maripaludis]
MCNLFILVENVDEQRFFESKPIKNLFVNKYGTSPNVLLYGCDTPENTNKYVKICDDNSWLYIVIRGNTSKFDISTCSRINTQKIETVILEIESWYIAGLNQNSCNDLGVKYVGNTDLLNKTIFNKITSSENADSNVPIMIKILEKYDVEHALHNNHSFKEFYEKYLM